MSIKNIQNHELDHSFGALPNEMLQHISEYLSELTDILHFENIVINCNRNYIIYIKYLHYSDTSITQKITQNIIEQPKFKKIEKIDLS